MARCRIERGKFYHGPGLEPGPLSFRGNVLNNSAIQDKYGSTIEIFNVIYEGRPQSKFPTAIKPLIA